MKSEIETALRPLGGLPLWDSHRAADVQVFKFGRQYPTKGRKGESILVGDYSLHVQCPWRIVQGNRIGVGSGDVYYPAGDDPYDEPEGFRWDVSGANRRDAKIRQWLEGFWRHEEGLYTAVSEPVLRVERLRADEMGGVALSLTNGCTLELFPTDSLPGELWRLLVPGSEAAHFVVTGEGIEE